MAFPAWRTPTCLRRSRICSCSRPPTRPCSPLLPRSSSLRWRTSCDEHDEHRRAGGRTRRIAGRCRTARLSRSAPVHLATLGGEASPFSVQHRLDVDVLTSSWCHRRSSFPTIRPRSTTARPNDRPHRRRRRHPAGHPHARCPGPRTPRPTCSVRWRSPRTLQAAQVVLAGSGYEVSARYDRRLNRILPRPTSGETLIGGRPRKERLRRSVSPTRQPEHHDRP